MPKPKRPKYIIGVDLGGTNIVVGACAEDGSKDFAMRSEPTRSDQGADAVVDRMVRMIETAVKETMAETGAKREDFLGVGVGAPGPLDREPKGGRNVVGVTIGTGIGGGLILEGRLYHGSSDIAGEIGHTTIDVTGRRCKCGNYGCLEAYASGPSIAERAREQLEGDHESTMYTMVDGELERLTAAIVYDAAKKGDETALEVVRETARFLGAGIANLLNVFNPDVVVIAGGVTQAGATLFDPLKREVRKRAFKAAVDACRIVPGSLPGNAGVVGAVASFKQQALGAV